MTTSPDPVKFPVWNPKGDIQAIQADLREIADRLRVHAKTLRDHDRRGEATRFDELISEVEDFLVPDLDEVGDEIEEAMRNRAAD